MGADKTKYKHIDEYDTEAKPLEQDKKGGGFLKYVYHQDSDDEEETKRDEKGPNGASAKKGDNVFSF